MLVWRAAHVGFDQADGARALAAARKLVVDIASVEPADGGETGATRCAVGLVVERTSR